MTANADCKNPKRSKKLEIFIQIFWPANQSWFLPISQLTFHFKTLSLSSFLFLYLPLCINKWPFLSIIFKLRYRPLLLSLSITRQRSTDTNKHTNTHTNILRELEVKRWLWLFRLAVIPKHSTRRWPFMSSSVLLSRL